MLIYFVNQLFHYLFDLYFGALAYLLKFFNPFIVKMAFSLLLLYCWRYTSHLVEIASNYQLTRMAEKFHVRANKVVGTHAGAKIVCLKFSLLKSVFELLLLLYECQRGLNKTHLRLQLPSKRVKADAHGARKFRDNRDTTGTVGQGPKFQDCPGHSGTVGNYAYASC